MVDIKNATGDSSVTQTVKRKPSEGLGSWQLLDQRHRVPPQGAKDPSQEIP